MRRFQVRTTSARLKRNCRQGGTCGHSLPAGRSRSFKSLWTGLSHPERFAQFVVDVVSGQTHVFKQPVVQLAEVLSLPDPAIPDPESPQETCRQMCETCHGRICGGRVGESLKRFVLHALHLVILALARIEKSGSCVHV